MKDGIFSRAAKYITPALVRQYCHEQATESGDELRCLSPIRLETDPSFGINLNTGLWIDRGTNESGNIFQLIARLENITAQQAAEKILRSVGAWEESTKKQKVPANPGEIPEKAWPELNEYIKSDWLVKKYGNYAPGGGWVWRNRSGVAEYAQVRYLHPTKKNSKGNPVKTDLPFYYGTDGKWHQALPPDYKKTRLPLYNANLLRDTIQLVILVEGCKCADAGQAVHGSEKNGILFMTWGGCSQIGIRRWDLLQAREDIRIIIWPDKDQKVGKGPYEQPGMKAAIDIAKKYLPRAEILDVYAFEKIKMCTKDGWDIADAIDAGHDIEKIISDCPRYHPPAEPAERPESLGSQDFLFLGYTAEHFVFLPKAAPYPFEIGKKTVTKTALLNLCSLDWWKYQFPYPGKTNTADWDSAIDWVIRESHAAGWFNQDRIKGSGFWRDGGRIYCNTGKNLITPDGEETEFQAMRGENIYIKDRIDLARGLSGSSATPEEGQTLRKLFEAQGFVSILQAWELLGWVLMAPFGSLLAWRPAAWLTGPTGSGKSFILENLVIPLLGEFAFVGSGKTTVAGIKRSVNGCSRAVVLDEMEMRGRDHWGSKNLQGLIELSRDTSSKGANQIIQASAGGGVDKYCIYSPFLFASIIPSLIGEAFRNRFFTPTLDGKKSIMEKKEETAKLIKVLSDPMKFARRIFRNIEQVLENVKTLQKEILNMLGDVRRSDNYGTVLAFLFALENDGPVTPEFLLLVMEMMQEVYNQAVVSDEEALMNEILEINVRTGHQREKSIGEMLMTLLCAPPEDAGELNDTLQTHGIFYNEHLGYIAIAFNHKALREDLKNSEYSIGYGKILKRHPMAISGELKQIRMGGGCKMCVRFTREAMVAILSGEDPEGMKMRDEAAENLRRLKSGEAVDD